MKKISSSIVDFFANGIERFFEIIELIKQRKKPAHFENAADLTTQSNDGNQAMGIAQGLDRIKDSSQAFARNLGQGRQLEHHAGHTIIHGGTQQLFQLCGDWLADITTGTNDQYLITDFGMNGHGYKYGIVLQTL